MTIIICFSLTGRARVIPRAESRGYHIIRYLHQMYAFDKLRQWFDKLTTGIILNFGLILH